MFDEALEHTLAAEGGFVNDPADRGGATRYGITEATARAHGYDGPMSELPEAVAREIYRSSYWEPLRLDDVADADVANKIFDLAVNMGPGAAGRILQRAAVINGADIAVDGKVGPATIAAVNDIGRRHARALLGGIVGYAFDRYRGIVERDPSQSRFIRGWLSRLVGGL